MRLRPATSMISLLIDAGFWPWHRGVLTLGNPMSSQRSPVLLESLEISSTTKSRIQEPPSNEPRNYLTSFILLLSRQLYASGLRHYRSAERQPATDQFFSFGAGVHRDSPPTGPPPRGEGDGGGRYGGRGVPRAHRPASPRGLALGASGVLGIAGQPTPRKSPRGWGSEFAGTGGRRVGDRPRTATYAAVPRPVAPNAG